MGFDRTLFIKKVTEDICCGICQNVLDNPVQCSKCKLWMCEQCQHKSTSTTATCIHQCQDVNKYMKNRIDELYMKCKYFQNGCMKILKQCQIEKHHYVCEFASFICNTKECYGKMSKKNAEYHVKSCPQSVVVCNICNKKMKKQDTHTHSCINWLFSVIDNLEIKNKVLAEEISDVKDNKNQFIKKNQDAISKLQDKAKKKEEEKQNLIIENRKLNQNYENIKQQSNMELHNKINDFQQSAENKLSQLWQKSDQQFELFSKRVNDRIKQLSGDSKSHLEHFNMKVYADSYDLVKLPKDIRQQDKSPIRLTKQYKKHYSPRNTK